jgi:predicted short-subunit dehydrogenase-like oxidoreductase (DUF2520 family)
MRVLIVANPSTLRRVSPAVADSSLTLMGPGRAGRALLRSWAAAGGRVAQVIVRTPEKAATARFGGAAVRALPDGRFDATEILVLAVPDDAIAACAEALAGKLACRFAYHLSGALGADALDPLRRAGASVASLHPLRPFTGAEGEGWRDALVAVEGDADAAERGEAIAGALHARPYRLSAEGKPLYHAAASLAAGGTVAVLSLAVRACVAAGIPESVAREALAGLAVEATAAAVRLPFEQALTGAVARRDVGTVRVHARSLAGVPDALALYRSLAEQILAATPGRGKEEEIRTVLREAAQRDGPDGLETRGARMNP